MCLTSVKETYDNPIAVVQDGRKHFSGTYDKPVSQQISKTFPLDEWIPAEGPMIRATDGVDYKAGFHVYEDEREVKDGRRVFFRNVTARGMQDRKVVLVAQELYIPSKPNGWPPKPGDPPPERKGALEKLKDRVVGKGGTA